MGPKLPGWPAGDQVEAKNALKMGQNRPKTGLFQGYSQNTPKIRQQALVLPLLRWPSLETKCGCTPFFEVFEHLEWWCTAQVDFRVSRVGCPAGLPRRAAVVLILTGHAVLV